MKYGFFGIAGPATAYASIFFSALLTPTFDWNVNSISDLGTGGAAMIFNFGMVAAGALLFVFSTVFSGKSARPFMLLSSASMILIGVFPKSYGSLHAAASIMFFLSAGLASFLTGIEYTAKHRKGLGAAIITCTAIFAAAWVFPLPFAFRELFSSLAAFLWVSILSVNPISFTAKHDPVNLL